MTREMTDIWVEVKSECALYADYGKQVILCDRLPRPATLICRLTCEQAAALRQELDQTERP